MTETVLRATYGDPKRPLRIGDLEISCYVLEDGTRVLSGRGMQTAVGLGQRHGALLSRFLQNKSINSFVSNKLAMALENPIRFVRPGRGGKLAVGYEATILTEVCDAILEARKRSKLTTAQLEIAEQCEILTRAFAKVGILALVDEATGYQEVRDKNALQAILDKYLTAERAAWAKTFPDEFYQQMFRLRGWEFNPLSVKRPGVIGHLTNDIVYSRVAPGVLDKLKKLNPKTESGRKKAKNFQFFTAEYGLPELKQHILNLIFLMKGSANWDGFHHSLDRAAPKFGNTLEIPFADDD